MRVLVIGGYGLLGLAIVKELTAQGNSVLALGRSQSTANKLAPHIDWVIRDLADMTNMQSWADILVGIDAVVNAAGALQTGSKDKLDIVHGSAVEALVSACEQGNVRTFVQISAPDARNASEHKFYQTKTLGDRYVKDSQLDWVVVRPGLVVGRTAYGGSHLLRALAAFPFVQPSLFSDRHVQTVALSDVAKTVCAAVFGIIPARSDFDLVEDKPQRVDEILAGYRAWLGFPKARFNLPVPPWIAMIGAKGADALGWAGWRLPFRSTSMKLMQKDVLGDPKPYKQLGLGSLSSFSQTLDAIPVSNAERWHARISLFMPLLLITLSLFWLASGIIGLLNVDKAVALLMDANVKSQSAKILVLGGSVIDIGLGLFVWLRRWTRAALIGMVIVTIAYLFSASILAPHLWSDPMGPLVKSIPALVLALFTSFFLEDR